MNCDLYPIRMQPRGKRRIGNVTAVLAAGLSVCIFSSCTQIQKPVAEPYYAATAPPERQELRWSNGKTPRSLDPARAAASPESDIVCALYEGLTEIDPATLDAVPAAAEKWTASEDGKTWVFHLRKDARWSNGKRVTAGDFVASWKRAAAMGAEAAHPELLENIVGLASQRPKGAATPTPTPTPAVDDEPLPPRGKGPSGPSDEHPAAAPTPDKNKPAKADADALEALDDSTLRVILDRPDADLPALLSDPMFRPVAGDGFDPEAGRVTNGPFTVTESGTSGLVLSRSETYWNRESIKLERIRFVPAENAEAALSAYKRGEIDAITNSDFEPLALKLLRPYGDFRQTTHNALNLYEFNTRNAPFSDRRVREALAVAIDRDRLVDTEFDGTAEAASDFLPMTKNDETLSLDIAHARDLLEKAGYPGGEGFPVIRLAINRNDAQQRVGRLVSRMWKANLNIETQIVVKEPGELESLRLAGEYDLIRRGVVLPTMDESASLETIFHSGGAVAGQSSPADPFASLGSEAYGPRPESELLLHATPSPRENSPTTVAPRETALTHEDALYQLYAIPLYSPTAYSLVKPYVHGLKITGLNSVSVRNISIDSSWSPPRSSGSQ
jgi:oligopeptide transport system substrate-binding protein